MTTSIANESTAPPTADRWWQSNNKITSTVAGVFEGGGAKGVAYAGALMALRDSGCWFRSVAGASAGAITAALIAAGLTPEEMSQETTQALSALKPPHFRLGLFSLRNGYGYLLTRQFKDWLEGLLAKQCKKYGVVPTAEVTFEDLWDATEIELNVVAADLSAHRQIVFSHIDTPRCQVMYAVLASSSIPFAFDCRELRVSKEHTEGNSKVFFHTIVDGGVWSNFPVFVFKDRSFRIMHKRPPEPSEDFVIGFLLDEEGSTEIASSDLEQATFVDWAKRKTSHWSAPAGDSAGEEDLVAWERRNWPDKLPFIRKEPQGPYWKVLVAKVKEVHAQLEPPAGFQPRQTMPTHRFGNILVGLITLGPRVLTWARALLQPEFWNQIVSYIRYRGWDPPRWPAPRDRTAWRLVDALDEGLRLLWSPLLAIFALAAILVGEVELSLWYVRVIGGFTAWVWANAPSYFLSVRMLLFTALLILVAIAWYGALVLMASGLLVILLALLGILIDRYLLRTVYKIGYGLVRTYVAGPGAPAWIGAAKSDHVVRLRIPKEIGTLSFEMDDRDRANLIERARIDTKEQLKHILHPSS